MLARHDRERAALLQPRQPVLERGLLPREPHEAVGDRRRVARGRRERRLAVREITVDPGPGRCQAGRAGQQRLGEHYAEALAVRDESEGAGGCSATTTLAGADNHLGRCG